MIAGTQKMFEGIEGAILEIETWSRDEVDKLIGNEILKVSVDHINPADLEIKDKRERVRDWMYVVIKFVDHKILTFYYNAVTERYANIGIEG
jgi:hypothetical protein